MNTAVKQQQSFPWISVVSTMCKAIGFVPNVREVVIPSTLGSFHVHFTDGTTGYYADVPYSVYWTVLTTPSVGQGLTVHVKRAGYAWILDTEATQKNRGM